MFCKAILCLFDFEIKDLMQFLGVAISGFCLLFTYKTFKQAENINRIQEERRREEEVRYKLEYIIRVLRIQCCKVVNQIINKEKWLGEWKDKLPKEKLEEEENKYNDLSKSDHNGQFNEMVKDYKLDENERKFLREICDTFVFTTAEIDLEIRIRNNFNKKPSDEDINAANSFLNDVRCAKQICEVYNFDDKMIDKLYLKIVFSQIYDSKKPN